MNLHLVHPTFPKGASIKGVSEEPKFLAETVSVWWWSQIRRCGLDPWSTSPERGRRLTQVHLITSNHTAAPFVCSKWLLSSKTPWSFSHAEELTSKFQMQLLLGEKESRTSAPNAWCSDGQGRAGSRNHTQAQGSCTRPPSWDGYNWFMGPTWVKLDHPPELGFGELVLWQFAGQGSQSRSVLLSMALWPEESLV